MYTLMKFSTRTRYGLRILLNLAQRDEDIFVRLQDLATEEDVSIKYLERIVRPLHNAGLLRAARGTGGGYALADSPDNITLDKVFYHLEGTLECVPHLEKETTSSSYSGEFSRNLWVALESNMLMFLQGITLRQLVKSEENKEVWSWVI